MTTSIMSWDTVSTHPQIYAEGALQKGYDEKLQYVKKEDKLAASRLLKVFFLQWTNFSRLNPQTTLA